MSNPAVSSCLGRSILDQSLVDADGSAYPRSLAFVPGVEVKVLLFPLGQRPRVGVFLAAARSKCSGIYQGWVSGRVRKGVRREWSRLPRVCRPTRLLISPIGTLRC